MTSSIPGVRTVHPRETWQDPRKPITGPPAAWEQVTMNVAHYTADDDLIDGDPGEYAHQLDDYMRAMQASYLSSRGYSVGYLWAVDWLGGAWEIRGWDYKSAANKGAKAKTGVVNVNSKTSPILYLVDGGDRLTSLAAATGRALGAEAQRRAGRTLGRPKPHSDLDYTSCCGDGIRLDIRLGLLDPRVDTIPIPPKPIDPPPTNGDYLVLGDLKMTNERRIYDSRANDDQQPSSMFAVATGVDPNTHSGVFCNVTAIAGKVAGYMGVGSNTSFNNFMPGQVVDNARPFNLNSDGTISLGAQGANGSPTNIHITVDLIAVIPK